MALAGAPGRPPLGGDPHRSSRARRRDAGADPRRGPRRSRPSSLLEQVERGSPEPLWSPGPPAGATRPSSPPEGPQPRRTGFLDDPLLLLRALARQARRQAAPTVAAPETIPRCPGAAPTGLASPSAPSLSRLGPANGPFPSSPAPATSYGPSPGATRSVWTELDGVNPWRSGMGEADPGVDDPVRVYVGQPGSPDRSGEGARALDPEEHRPGPSTCSRCTTPGWNSPAPGLHNRPRTPFSFQRFYIPQLAGYRGGACTWTPTCRSSKTSGNSGRSRSTGQTCSRLGTWREQPQAAVQCHATQLRGAALGPDRDRGRARSRRTHLRDPDV